MKNTLLIILFSLFTAVGAFGQNCASIANKDGFRKYEKDYIQNFSENEVTYRVTFYKDFVYRLVVCSDNNEAIEWELHDLSGNVLFSNKNYELSNYWDFRFETSIECLVKINPDNISSELENIILYLGYKD